MRVRRVVRDLAARRRFATFWLGSSALIGMLGAVWVLAVPLGSGPDEAAHVIKAAAIVRGELIGHHDPRLLPAVVGFRVPAAYEDMNFLPVCYLADPQVPASCAGGFPSRTRPLEALTYVGRYPPLYYLLVGWPTLLSTSGTTIYLMRLASVLINSLFLGLALALGLEMAENLVVAGGVLLAITPVVVYLSAVVEPNGLEASAALCLWTALALMMFGAKGGNPPPALVNAAGASATVLVLIRALSVAWMLAILIVMLGVALPPRTVRALRRQRRARRWAAAILAASVAAIAWVITQDALDVVPMKSQVGMPALRGFMLALDDTPRYLAEMFGSFNPRGTVAPVALDLLFGGVLGALAASALWFGGKRARFAIMLILLGTVAAGPVLTTGSAQRYGVIWSGRYSLPFAVGLPILAAAVTSRRLGRQERFAGISAVFVGVGLVCQIGGLYWLLRRFATGTGGPIDVLFKHLSWEPPLGVTVLSFASLGVTLLISAWTFVLAPRLRSATWSGVSPDVITPQSRAASAMSVRAIQ